jgi:phosphotransacetylase
VAGERWETKHGPSATAVEDKGVGRAMEAIRTLDQLVAQLKGAPARRLAVAAGHDENTMQAAARAATEGVAKVILVGDERRIGTVCGQLCVDASVFTVIDEPNDLTAGTKARDLVRTGEAEVLMKGLISTDKFMRLILDKEKGLLPRGHVLSHLAVLDIPAYQKTHGKLLFVADVAVIPAPDLATKVKIVE